MCFYKKEGKEEHRISKEKRVKCYKMMEVVNGGYNSVFHPRRDYSINVHSGTDIPYNENDSIISSCLLDGISKEELTEECDKAFYLTEQVVHSYINIYDLKNDYKNCLDHSERFVIFECEIPEDEIYWENDKQFVSFSVILKRRV